MQEMEAMPSQIAFITLRQRLEATTPRRRVDVTPATMLPLQGPQQNKALCQDSYKDSQVSNAVIYN